MDIALFSRITDYAWQIKPHGAMRVSAVIYANEQLIRAMDDKVYQQICNVATLPGIVQAAYAMPDAHWGYGFPIGGVAAFDAEDGGVISAGGVGFDISCGVRCLRTGLKVEEVEAVQKRLADTLYSEIPAGLGSTGYVHLNASEMNKMLMQGAAWAVERGFGSAEDFEYIEERGRMQDACPEYVSDLAKRRQRDEMGTLGSGNHYLEVQKVAEVFNDKAAQAFGIQKNDVVVSIHCGSRGLGHQIGTEFLKSMLQHASEYGINLPDRELACAPIQSNIGERYLGAMRAAMNCALANRQILTHLTRRVFERFFSNITLPLMYDVSHNTCKVEKHVVDSESRSLYVHRKGATRAFGPKHKELPLAYREVGQPVLIGGSMGTASFILAGCEASESMAFSSACHGAGRAMSRHQAQKKWQGKDIVQQLESRGILIRCPSFRGVAEEAPDAYKNVSAVVDVADAASLANKVARLEPMICIKG